MSSPGVSSQRSVSASGDRSPGRIKYPAGRARSRASSGPLDPGLAGQDGEAGPGLDGLVRDRDPLHDAVVCRPNLGRHLVAHVAALVVEELDVWVGAEHPRRLLTLVRAVAA